MTDATAVTDATAGVAGVAANGDPASPVRPLIAVGLRFVDQRPAVNPLTGAVTRDPAGAAFAPADGAALEHALRIAAAWSGTVLAVTVGPAVADEALRPVAALGVRVLRVAAVEPAPAGPDRGYLAELAADERALAARLVAAIRTVGEPALVLCGDRSSDRGTGALPALLAHELGAAQALGLVDLRIGGDPPLLLAERRLDGGRRERLVVPRPAVCSVEAAGVRLRRAPLPATLRAARAAVEVLEVPLATGGVAAPVVPEIGSARAYRPRPRVIAPPVGTARDRLRELTGVLDRQEPPTVVQPDSAAGAADALLGYLSRAGYLQPDQTWPDQT